MDTVKVEFKDAIKIISYQPVKTEVQWQQPTTFIGKIITPEEWFLSEDLKDVEIKDVTHDDILRYDAAEEKWINKALITSSALSELTDVLLTDVLKFDHLEFDGNKWINVQDITIKAGQKIIFNGS